MLSLNLKFDRQLEETNADGFTVTDTIHLENELQTALMQIRSRKVIYLCTLLPNRNLLFGTVVLKYT